MSYWTDGKGKKVAVIGLGRSGKAASKLLAENEFQVIGMDQNSTVIECPGCCEIIHGEHDPKLLLTLDGIVLSPGVDPSLKFLKPALEAGIPIIGELELGSRFAKNPILAVTGSNGKTTTVEWLGFLLKNAGRTVSVSGNVGYAFCEAVMEQPEPDFFVVEVSSYQLQTIEKFRPRAAAILNITPDHLQRHGSFGNYRICKERIFRNQHSEDVLILNADDINSIPLIGLTVGIEKLFSIHNRVRSGIDVHESEIWLVNEKREPVIITGELSLAGAHNLSNALAVIGLASAAGVSIEEMKPGLTRFPGVPHRLEKIIEIDGVLWINDSKATNQDSLKTALTSVNSPVVLIAGGLSKHSNYSEISEDIKSKVKQLILIGEAALELSEAWRSAAPVLFVSSMDEAVDKARIHAEPGDVVLLSPACASFDMYSSFEERGDHFRQLVEGL